VFAQIKGVVDVAISGFKGIREFRSKRGRDAAVCDMLRFYFLLKDCVDEGESLIVEAGSNPVAKIKALSPQEATATVRRWDVVLRRQGIRLRMLEGLLFGQPQLAIINPKLESALDRAIGSKMTRAVTLYGIGATLFLRCMLPVDETETEKARLIAVMAGARDRGKIDLNRIRREVSALRETLEEYRGLVQRLASDEEIVRLSKKARRGTQVSR
jgi:hypothetical protein